MEQVNALMDYKRIFCYHPSHHHGKRKKNIDKKNMDDKRDDPNAEIDNDSKGGILSTFVSLLAEPLSRTGASRTDSDHLTIELVLHLFRNLLAIEPILYTSPLDKELAISLQNELIILYEQENILDIILVLSSDIELPENAPYNLLIMELLHHLYKNQDPALVAKIGCNSNDTNNIRFDNEGTTTNHQPQANKDKVNPSNKQQQKSSSSLLLSLSAGKITENLKNEKQRQSLASMNRHSNFAGTFRVQRPNHSNDTTGSADPAAATSGGSYASAAMVLGYKQREQLQIVQQEQKLHRKRNKKLEPYIGSSLLSTNSSTIHTNIKKHSSLILKGTNFIIKQRVQQVLCRFCIEFISICYGPVMKSLKNEFRRDSIRLEESDTSIFFNIVWFLKQFYRLYYTSKRKKSSATNSDTDAASSIGQLIFTMDVFTFNFVISSIETYQTTKKYTKVASGVALLSEMIHLLYIMLTSNETTEHIMALGLMDRLYYSMDEPLDNVHKLLSKWLPGTNTREYSCNVLELCYMTFKLLDTNAKLCLIKEHESENVVNDNNDEDKKEQDKHDTVTKMKKLAAEYDVSSYFGRKIVSNNFITFLIHLLSQYDINAPNVNHRIMAMLIRTCKHVITLPDSAITDEDYVDENNVDDVNRNPLALKKAVTYQPLLYNVRLFGVFNTILNDKTIRNDKDYTSLLQFISTIVYSFANTANKTNIIVNNGTNNNKPSHPTNPMLFAEILFKHSLPHRYCDSISNAYVSEEIKMLVDREILREQTIKLSTSHYDDYNVSNNADEEENQQDEEDEFVTNSSLRRTTNDQNNSENNSINNNNDVSDDDEELEFIENDLNEKTDKDDFNNPIKSTDLQESSSESSVANIENGSESLGEDSNAKGFDNANVDFDDGIDYTSNDKMISSRSPSRTSALTSKTILPVTASDNKSKHRRRIIDDDDDDDDSITNVMISGTTNDIMNNELDIQGNKRRRLVIDDDDDNEESVASLGDSDLMNHEKSITLDTQDNVDLEENIMNKENESSGDFGIAKCTSSKEQNVIEEGDEHRTDLTTN